MTAFALVTGLLTASLIAALMLVMPSLVRQTLPLGVAVPSTRSGEPVIRQALVRYRWSVLAAWAVAVVLTLALAAVDLALALIVPVFFLVAAGTVAYALNRSTILAAKKREGWYRDVPVRLRGSITPVTPTHSATGWFIAALVLLVGTAGVGIAAYPGLPDPLPIHWNAAGHADAWAAKSPWSVFGPLLIGLALAVFLYALSFLLRRMPTRGGALAVKTEIQRHLLGRLLGQVLLVAAAQIAWLTLVGWFAPGASWTMIVGTVGMIVLLFAAIIAFLVQVRRAAAAAEGAEKGATDGAPDDHAAHEHPDDDRYWKAGLFYVNREDPAVFVPKRFGIGWTVNLGSAGGKAIGLVLLLVIAVSLALPVLAPGGH